MSGPIGLYGKNGLSGPTGPVGYPVMQSKYVYAIFDTYNTQIIKTPILIKLYKIHNISYMVLNLDLNFMYNFDIEFDDNEYFGDVQLRYIIPFTDNNNLKSFLKFRIKTINSRIKLYFDYDSYDINKNIKINTTVKWIK